MRVFVAGATGDLMLEVVLKRQMPVVDGGTGIWSFTEVTDAAAAAVAVKSRKAA